MKTFRVTRTNRLCSFASMLFCLIAVPSSLHAQALPAASKTMDISAFGGYSYVNPDFGPTKNNAVTFGVNVTRYFHWPVAPSLEARVGITGGEHVKEKTYLFGFRAQKDYTRFHPYADFLIGRGQIDYVTPPYPNAHSDSGTVFSYGGGVDVDVYRHIQAKADFQMQSWNLGKNGSLVPNGGDYTLSPYVFTIGVAYRIPFRPHKRQSDFYR